MADENMYNNIDNNNCNNIKFDVQPSETCMDMNKKHNSSCVHLINYAKKLHRKRCTKYILCKTCCELNSNSQM